jgi:nitrogen-specific signal transduction histidine kinase
MSLSQSDVDRMVTVLRHRFRNHLSGMRTALSMLAQESEDAPPSVREYFPLLLKECSRMDDLVCRFGYALEDRCDGPAGDMFTVVERACMRAKEVLPTASVDVACDDFRKIQVDHVPSVENCIYELLINAVEARGGEPVEVTGSLDGGDIIFTVRDYGPDVDDEVFCCVKQPFFSTKSKHVGLGLSIAQNTVAHMGGSLSIERLTDPAGVETSVRIPRLTE